jgi:hypothetical protein
MVVRKVKTGTQAFNVDLLVSSTIDEAMRIFAAKAIEGRNKVQKKNRPSRTTTYVGAREGADEFSVRPGETIRYHFDYLKTIVVDAHKRLRLNSPVQIGPSSWGTPPDQYRYKDSHIILAGGQAYDDPLMVPDDATEVVITNLMPYARKVEMRGWRGTTRFHAPYHTYELTATELKRYSNMVNIKFTFIDMPGVSTLSKKAIGTATKRQQAAAIRYPALIISLR